MKLQKGFTLIELLIVIGVLGILATGLLAAVDPFEQLKKARDANNRNAVIELHNATTRYYATHAALPWDETSATQACKDALLPGGTRSTVGVTLTAATTCVTMLETDGELKTGFVNAIGAAQAAKTYVVSPSTTQVVVCFSPEGKGLFNDALTKYNSSGTDVSATTCSQSAKAGLSPGTTCFWCVR
ncbi:type II secretion system protein [Candidatus Collierbacteria bacterium]|nr:type II secretion system protein [Candidatus Collierbacteria bacterium]